MTTWKDHKATTPLVGAARDSYDASHRGMGVGYLILRARSAAGLTQEALADRIGTSQSTIARWESGSQLPSVRSLTRVADATGFQLRVGLRDARSREVTVSIT